MLPAAKSLPASTNGLRTDDTLLVFKVLHSAFLKRIAKPRYML